MNTQLAYSYSVTARIMKARGASIADIEGFLIANQNVNGYIPSSAIDSHFCKNLGT